MRVIEKDAVMFDNDFVHVYIYLENTYDSYHKHAFNEIKYILSGVGYHTLYGGTPQEVMPGDVIFVNKDAAHSIRSINENERIVVYNVIFDGEFVNVDESDDKWCSVLLKDDKYKILMSKEIEEIPYFKFYDANLKIRNIINDMYDEYNKKSYGYLNMIHSKLEELLLRLMRECLEGNQKENSTKSKITFEVITYIKSNFENDITLRDIAGAVCLSPNYLCKLFKKETGQSIFDYISKLKIQRVCEMLSDTDKTFTEISIDLGYQNESFLRKSFKEVVGLTPREYKKKIKE